ncbi:MAG: hypothetical protein AAGA70_04250 [Pseudomonadota bacterium]
MTKIQQFCLNEDGAVTVDMVVMMAAAVGIALAAMAVVGSGLGTISNDTANYVAVEITPAFSRTSTP